VLRICLNQKLQLDFVFFKEPGSESLNGRLNIRVHSASRPAKVKDFGFHAIRHLTASILYHQGEPVANIQAILRHRGPKTTEHYLKRIGLERVRNALESLSPKTADAEVIVFEKMFGNCQPSDSN
jgi:integrase